MALTRAFLQIRPSIWARQGGPKSLHTAPVIGSIPAAATPIDQSGVRNSPTSPLEGVAIAESASVSALPGSPRFTERGFRRVDVARDTPEALSVTAGVWITELTGAWARLQGHDWVVGMDRPCSGATSSSTHLLKSLES